MASNNDFRFAKPSASSWSCAFYCGAPSFWYQFHPTSILYVTANKKVRLFYERKHITVHICETVQHFDTLVIIIR